MPPFELIRVICLFNLYYTLKLLNTEVIIIIRNSINNYALFSAVIRDKARACLIPDSESEEGVFEGKEL